jgi:threonine synthase
MSNLYYKSTRSSKEKILSSQAIVNGIAGDGGLYVPSSFPKIDKPFLQLKEMDYRQLAFYIMKKYLTDFRDEELKSSIDSAYDAKFDSPLIAPLTKVGEVFFLELYHGLTLAFKDMALSILPHILKVSVSKLNIGKDIVILTATSGDTGKAALEGFANVDGTKIIVFYPKEGVSQIQERQMTTQEGNNTYVIAIEGNFDDAQTGVKRIFNDKEFNRILNNNGYMFSSANSINIGRLIPQIVYYIYAYIKLLKLGEISSGEKINVVVPTGNFGNILSSYYAKKMGLPINKFICASNENNVLYDFINTGIYDKQRELKVTSSPSMDILISSNLERLLYDLCDNDASMVNDLIGELNKSGRYEINSKMKNKLGDFYGEFTTDNETIETIREVFRDFNYLIDTHTAVGYDVYKKYIKATGDKTKTVIVSTASAFKFPESIIGAIDSKFRVSDKFALIERMAEITNKNIPKGIKDIGRRKILHNTICKQEQMKSLISEILGL